MNGQSEERIDCRRRHRRPVRRDCAPQGGLAVELVEVHRQWNVYHVGIVVQGNAIRAMVALGIADQCVAAGFAYDGLRFLDIHGNLLSHIHGIPLAGPNYPSDLGLARPALHEVLSNAALAAGADVRLGVTFTELQQSEMASSYASQTAAPASTTSSSAQTA